MRRPATTPVLRIVEPGILTTVQDQGRRGLAAMGVTVSGAVDRSAYALANRLVGNSPGCAVLEVTFGGFEAVTTGATWIATTGATAPLWVDGVRHGANSRVHVPAGATIRLGQPAWGLRTYLAVRGGLDVPQVLGSRSRDTLAGIGPAPLERGDEITLGTDWGRFPPVDHAPVSTGRSGAPIELPLVLGPRDDWFTGAALSTLAAARWTVGAASNRIGVRLIGPELTRAVSGELPSEGVPVGAVQVPSSGPIVFLDDHPVTGGYPVIGVVTREGLDSLAQARAGDTVVFRPVPVDFVAHEAARQRISH
ncbi:MULTISPECIES: biotin-dependent carboxyltransferase family protein [unclassified Aeromicrobium]|uniref:5-oxoprolinase subunit C family protein n=1 Tax=unclassified Aeromicrobium TaxID=2633570 RepID=UPI00396AF96C